MSRKASFDPAVRTDCTLPTLPISDQRLVYVGEEHRTNHCVGVITRLIIDQLCVLLLEDIYWHALGLSDARVPLITRFVRLELGDSFLIVICNIFRSFD